MGAVRRSEGVIDVDVAVFGELSGKELVAGFFFSMEAKVLEQGHLARHQALGHVEGLVAHAVFGKLHGLAQQAGQGGHDVFQRQLGARSLGPAEVAHQHHRSTAVDQGLDGGNGPSNAGVVGDGLGVVQGHVEVHAHQRALAFEVEGGKGHGVKWGKSTTQAWNREAMLTRPST